MDILEAIITRRSIRKYTGEPVSEEALQTILRAGCYAPSAMNRQPWHFIIIRKPETLQAITKFQPYTKMLPQASCCVVVCGDKIRQPLTGFLAEDCSAAIQNMLLAAHALGLGTVWCGIYPVSPFTKAISKLLQLPAHILPIGLVAIGHPDEQRTVPERFDPAKVHLETW
jgi:nitroreductase